MTATDDRLTAADLLTQRRRGEHRRRHEASERKWAEALARLPDLPPHQMSEDGCVNLIAAFWEQIRHEMAHRSYATRKWVAEGEGFLTWCDISHIAPDELRTFLLEEVWGNGEYRRKSRNFGGE
jgi:hypothetical protein